MKLTRRIKVPKDEIDTIKDLFKLSEDQENKLIETILMAKEPCNLAKIIEDVRQKVKNNDVDFEGIINTILLFHMLVYEWRDENLDQSLDFIIESIKEDIEIIDEEKSKRLRSFYEKIISKNQMLWVIAKARVLMFEHDNLIFKSKIITDVRPIFFSDVNEPPSNHMIYHSLRLNTIDLKGKQDSMTFVFLKEELEKLKSMIDRALEKENTWNETMLKKGQFCVRTDDC